MAEKDRANEADRFAHGTGHTEKHEAERDGFRPGVEGGGQTTLPEAGGGEPSSGAGASQGGNSSGGGSATTGGVGVGVAGPGPQSIEATTAALGDMEPSAGAGEGGASKAETAGDKS
jgi:hypothetical protein